MNPLITPTIGGKDPYNPQKKAKNKEKKHKILPEKL